MKHLSIIIPAYNAEATINRCLDSVYSLPVSEDRFEVIVVDDCSTDYTVDLIRAYENNHSNLVLLVQPENRRQGAARNLGLSAAKGEYIVFLDSDDEIVPGAISALNVSQKNSLDMVVMRYERFSSDGHLDRECVLPYKSDTVFTGIAFQTEYPYWCTGPCVYLYSRLFLERVNYPFAEDVLFEDSDFVSVHLFHSVKMAYCNDCGYRVWTNPSSTTHTISYKHVCDYAILGTRMLSFYQQIEDKGSFFASSILEGGSYNIMRSCKNLFKLRSISEVNSFYSRFDLFADRSALLSYHEPAYCWNRWTRFCMKYKLFTIIIVGSVLSLNLVSLLRRIKR
jgi:glycosyltransferase involved in cell wall biosynthesis